MRAIAGLQVQRDESEGNMAKIGEREKQLRALKAAQADRRSKRHTAQSLPKPTARPAPQDGAETVSCCGLCQADPAEVIYALAFLEKHRARSRAGMKKYRKSAK